MHRRQFRHRVCKGLIEIQGSAEGATFSREEFNKLMDLAEKGVAELVIAQKAATS